MFAKCLGVRSTSSPRVSPAMVVCPWGEEVEVPAGNGRTCTQHFFYKDFQQIFTTGIAFGRKTEHY